MSSQIELRNAIKRIINSMRINFDISENIIQNISDKLVAKGYKKQIEVLGNALIMELIADELDLLCDDLIYQISIERVVSFGLKDHYRNSNYSFDDAANNYAKCNLIDGDIDEILSQVVTNIVTPVMKQNPDMTRREAIILIGQNNSSKVSLH